jgi:hypothetical protein
MRGKIFQAYFNHKFASHLRADSSYRFMLMSDGRGIFPVGSSKGAKWTKTGTAYRYIMLIKYTSKMGVK